MIDKKELLKLIKSVDWSQFVEWGTVEVIIKKGKPTRFVVHEGTNID